MKVYRLEIMVLDLEGFGEETIRVDVEQSSMSPNIATCESRDIGEWHDDHPLNNMLLWKDEFDRLFKKEG